MTRGTTVGAEAARPGVSILLVDDDVELCDLMREFFDRRDIRLEAVHDGRLGLTRTLGGGHDLLLLRALLPRRGGSEPFQRRRPRPGHDPPGGLPPRRDDRGQQRRAGTEHYPYCPSPPAATAKSGVTRTSGLAPPAMILESSGMHRSRPHPSGVSRRSPRFTATLPGRTPPFAMLTNTARAKAAMPSVR